MTVQAHQVPCQSCGGDFLTESVDEARCRGCDLVVCQSCVDVFEHIGDGAHGTGNPAQEVKRLRHADAGRACS